MSIDRRSFLVASAAGYAGLHLGGPKPLHADKRIPSSNQFGNQQSGGGNAKSVILRCPEVVFVMLTCFFRFVIFHRLHLWQPLADSSWV